MLDIEDEVQNNLKVKKFETIQTFEPIFDKIGFNKAATNCAQVDLIASNCNQFISEIVPQTRKRDQLCKSIAPYLSLQLHTKEDVPLHRNICIVLSSLILNVSNLNVPNLTVDSKQLFAYLNRTLCATSDMWTIMHALIGLTELMSHSSQWISEDNLHALRRSRKVSQLIAKLKSRYDNLNYAQWLNSLDEQKNVEIQLYLYVDKFHKILHELNKSYWFVGEPMETAWHGISLNASDKSNYLQLSPDGLCARSDRKWQSVRSARSDIVYYEVTLVTNGAIRIGWSTVHSDLSSAKVGDDVHSVAFDGYNRCVWHDSVVVQLDHVTQWKAGDVVGCRINLETRLFGFTLNGCPIRLQSYLNFAPFPYHVSASLSPGQQCFFNFGQVTFKHASIHEWDIYELLRKREPIRISGSTVINSIFNVSSTNTMGNINMACTQNSACSNSIEHKSQPTILPALKPEESNTKSICGLCDQATTGKRLRFECCDHIKFCLDCSSILPDCLKCAKKQQQSQQLDNTPGPSSNVLCFLCNEQMTRKRRRFECCDKRLFCHGCSKVLQNWQKCKC